MLKLKKQIKINPVISTSTDEYLPVEFNIPFYENCPKQLYFSNNNNYNLSSNFKIKTNDIISVNLIFKNESNSTIYPLKLKFSNDSNFKFIPGSLINSNTKEVYSCDNFNDNCVCLCKLEPNEKLDVVFYIKAIFKNLINSSISNYINLLSPLSSNEPFIEEDNMPLIITVDQAILQINTDSNCGKIEIENTGCAPVNNMIYKYSTPIGFISDISCVTAKLNNKPFKVYAKKIDNDVLFNISNIPKCDNNIPSKLIISFDSQNFKNIHSSSMTIM
ncbi:hypothetical protein [Clostridium sp. CMCC3677]|uniref:hypothetical protein n=1 Tax=Clostridium sp. CMCC3677 TaxID=2949963 RepID=UPI0013F03CE4|nr:hypothetical protein [Clostridium sp. CMCC3677]NFG61295.1 hypothetical protein [Clostridium botulinum]NFQ09234.1 hypothetical protein [Clostridium botulinum]